MLTLPRRFIHIPGRWRSNQVTQSENIKTSNFFNYPDYKQKNTAAAAERSRENGQKSLLLQHRLVVTVLKGQAMCIFNTL